MRLSHFINFIVLLFTAGSMLLQFLTVLSGTKDSGVLRKWYWLSVDTSEFQGASPITQYTLWGWCSSSGSDLDDTSDSVGCSAHKAAFGLEPDTQFEGDQQVPQWFSDNHHKVYWLTRLLFPWIIIALAFETPVLFMSICSISKRRFGIVNSLLTLVAFLFQASASAMATVVYVQSRDAFKNAGYDARIGRTLMGFMWAATFMLFWNFLLYCCIRPHHATEKTGASEETAFAPPAHHTNQEVAGPDVADTTGGRFFGFRNSTKGKTTADDSSFVRAH